MQAYSTPPIYLSLWELKANLVPQPPVLVEVPLET